VGIDFLLSDAAGYREPRQLLTGIEGIKTGVRTGTQPLVVWREVRAISTACARCCRCVFSRDVIDLAMMEQRLPALRKALAKAVLWQKIRALRRLLKPV